MTDMNNNMRTWLITGASSGLGRDLAEHVLVRGDRVVLAARSLPALQELAARFPDTALAVALDVTDARQRQDAVTAASERFGAIDVLVNNAAIDFIGAIEEQEEADYRATFEVNLFAVIAMMRSVLPGMRARRQGTIVNVSSMDGIAALPANGYYSASKFALEGLTEALWQEVEPLGLRAFLVEAGSLRTGIEQRTKASGAPIADYAATAGAFRDAVAHVTPDNFPGDPVRVARAIYEVVASGERRHWVILGSDAHRRIGVKLDALRAEHEAGRERAFSTDFPEQAAAPVL
jgi:NAD(P)-dependent dehydrogenase (short-subunit alcohol dehydrogenase family)